MLSQLVRGSQRCLIIVIYCAIVLVLLVSPVQASAAMQGQSVQENHRFEAMQFEAMQSEAIYGLINQARAAWISGDADGFANLFTPAGEFIVPGLRLQGREAIRKITADASANLVDVTIEIRRVILDANQAAVEWHWEDTDRATGQRNRADDVIVIDFSETQISRWREYIDTQTPQADSPGP